MIRIARNRRRSFVLLLVMTVIVMVMMSYFGFRLKGFRPKNHVKWSDAGVGLTFKRFAIAHTKDFFSSVARLSGSCLTIECAVEPEFSKRSGFRFLLLFHDGRDEHQLVVGQWRSSIFIMNGDDYSYQRKIPRISVQLDDKAHRAQLMTIVSSASGTAVYLDGHLKKRKSGLVLKLPDKVEQTRLVVGNNLRGNLPWNGKISGLALYDRAIEEEKILKHYQTWYRGNSFNSFKPDAPQLLYAFDEGKGNIVHNRIGPGLDLMVPEKMQALRKSVLSWPQINKTTMQNVIRDVVVNLLGFIPLGLVLTATLNRLEGVGGRTIWAAVLLYSFCFSLIIEIVQIWMPSRDSSILDLILNTFGGWLGVVLYNICRRWVGTRVYNSA